MKYFILFLLLFSCTCRAQTLYSVTGQVKCKQQAVSFAAVALQQTRFGILCDSSGTFRLEGVKAGNYYLLAEANGYAPAKIRIEVPLTRELLINMVALNTELEEVVVTGNLKETAKDDSPVDIDIITPAVFQKTAIPNLFEATGMVNGVKPQINCNVCNTGDIHINGMEGPYTLILIDGMPIVSGLSSVYGLMGIPASMIERLEVAKGPSAALFGSEAMGGTINLITKKAGSAPAFYMDYFGTSYLENNLDISAKFKPAKNVNWLIGANGYYYDKVADINQDGFTDVTLQQRVSLFNKINVERVQNRQFDVALRLFYEDRWGGETNWKPAYRGGDSVYGESIYTGRAELISKYQWPVKEKIFSQVSYNYHHQNSVYGTTSFNALQSTAFVQTYWNKQVNSRNDFILGIAYKNLWFDDNTSITRSANGTLNLPENSHTSGLFVQNETRLDSAGKHKLLLGARLDYNNVYRFIPSPRIAYKWSPSYKYIFRLNFGTGFRIVNVFTEDHAALTGAREVVFVDRIRPEESYNLSLNAIYKMKALKGAIIIWDAAAFYYYFTNKIFANYDSDPNKVIYNNLDGYAYSRGFSLNASLAGTGAFKFNVGATYADVKNINRDSSGNFRPSQQLLAPLWSGNFAIGYILKRAKVKTDLTGNCYGPQRLPVLPNDYRPEYSPWFCLLNIQVTKTLKDKYDCYAGIKNLLNFLPNDPIMRPQDPFDKRVGDSVDNPNGYTFDPNYNYAPVQGIRWYLGVRMSF